MDVWIIAQMMAAFIATYYVLTAGLNKKAGMTGIPDFGHAMFFAIGGIVVGHIAARVAAVILAPELGISRAEAWRNVLEKNTQFMPIVNEHLAQHPLLSISLIVFSIVVAMILGGLLGWLASYPALRLKGDYLAIMLLAASEGLRVFVTYTTSIMGKTPTVGLTRPTLFAFTGNPPLWSTVFLVVIAVLVFVFAERFYNSPSGRLFRAVRDDEESAEALGKDVAKVRRDAMIIGSALAALAGAIASMNFWMTGSSIAPKTVFDRVLWTFWPWAIMIVGGMSSNRGTAVTTIIIGALIIGPIRIYKDSITRMLHVSALGIDPGYFANALEYFLIGFLILGMLFFKPSGIIPEPPSWTLSRNKIKEILRRVTE